jgi:LacI family transcriptional regulator
VTVIAQDSAGMAHAALHLMTARLAEPERPPETVTVPVALIARGSGERPPPAI